MKTTDDEEMTAPMEEATSGEVTLCFTKNRAYELVIGNTRYDFTPYSSLDVPASVLDHPDFAPVKDYFTVKR